MLNLFVKNIYQGGRRDVNDSKRSWMVRSLVVFLSLMMHFMSQVFEVHEAFDHDKYDSNQKIRIYTLLWQIAVLRVKLEGAVLSNRRLWCLLSCCRKKICAFNCISLFRFQRSTLLFSLGFVLSSWMTRRCFGFNEPLSFEVPLYEISCENVQAQWRTGIRTKAKIITL